MARAPLAPGGSAANTWLASLGVFLFIWGPAALRAGFAHRERSACRERGTIPSESSAFGAPKLLREAREPCRVPGLCCGRGFEDLRGCGSGVRARTAKSRLQRDSGAEEIIIAVSRCSPGAPQGGEGRQQLGDCHFAAPIGLAGLSDRGRRSPALSHPVTARQLLASPRQAGGSRAKKFLQNTFRSLLISLLFFLW